MAKLSAHGDEIARVSHTATIAGTEYHVHLSFRSDGHILRRLVARNIHNTQFGASPHHDYGWKLWKKAKPGRDIAARQASMARRVREAAEKAGTLL